MPVPAAQEEQGAVRGVAEGLRWGQQEAVRRGLPLPALLVWWVPLKKEKTKNSVSYKGNVKITQDCQEWIVIISDVVWMNIWMIVQKY